MHELGFVTLNISSTLYLIWLLPQIFLNFKRQDTEGLSMLMHGILCIGTLTDLLYGFGLDFPWQYKMVTIAGILSLAIQHYQFGRYGLHTPQEKYTYRFLSLTYFILLVTALYLIHFSHYQRHTYDAIGMISNACWMTYLLPQLIKNYRNHSTIGLSVYFIYLSLFLNTCDLTSAFALQWDYPSKIGPFLDLMGNTGLLLQVIYYAKQRRSALAFDC